ncbi:hypothetical protein V1477_004021 [Vespula maculifrons]|uniref:Uncharacterized protein n=1 Tax=Vespula maculifrons TaxID=7453 RepID=A0ABD2CRI6_VESMC
MSDHEVIKMIGCSSLVLTIVIECVLWLWLGHEAKKRLYAEEAPTYCGSRGQLLGYKVIFEVSTEHFENNS